MSKKMKFKSLVGGMYVEVGETCPEYNNMWLRERSYCIRNQNGWDMDNWYKVTLQICGCNLDPGLTIYTQGGNESEALDKAVDFAMENKLNFLYTDIYEAKDNDTYDYENDTVIDCVRCGESGVYIEEGRYYITEVTKEEVE